jgi:formate dehydrogenase major subunit/formate dehydrogenase alpha subunit
MAPGDAEKLGLSDKAMATIASRRGNIRARVHLSHKAFPGTVFIPFHFAEAAANTLTHAALDPTAKIPEFKVCAVRVSD